MEGISLVPTFSMDKERECETFAIETMSQNENMGSGSATRKVLDVCLCVCVSVLMDHSLRKRVPTEALSLSTVPHVAFITSLISLDPLF